MRNIRLMRHNYYMDLLSSRSFLLSNIQSLRQNTSLSAGTASASSEAKSASCGVFGHVLFPQESTYYDYAKRDSSINHMCKWNSHYVDVFSLFFAQDKESTGTITSHIRNCFIFSICLHVPSQLNNGNFIK
ncbi:hypothetical protein JOC48_001001 [Aquibacillus albus]|uniref:Uncharacterized protein n=1 Tax=Aquibacillus albus TaxID=1168171 RepID=A0ABS2MX90_9BACI|nr:hypothetical protein [Aquibacillus albus]